MARTQANLHTSAFDPDSSLMRCSGPAVLLYLRLLAAQDINLCGVLKFQPAALAATLPGDWTADDVALVLDELDATRHVFVDHEIGELVVATFMHHDRVLGGAQMVMAAAQQFTGVVSQRIRQAVREQLPEPVRDLWPKGIRAMKRSEVQALLDGCDAKHFTPTFTPTVTGTTTPTTTPPVTPNGTPPVTGPVSTWRLEVGGGGGGITPPSPKSTLQTASQENGCTRPDPPEAGSTNPDAGITNPDSTVGARMHAAAEHVARHEAKRRAPTDDPVQKLDAWLATEIPRRVDRHRGLWSSLLADRPTLTAQQLAQAVTDPDRFETDRNAANILAAADAIAERNARRTTGDFDCPHCEDTGIRFDPTDNLGHECNHQPDIDTSQLCDDPSTTDPTCSPSIAPSEAP